MDAAKRNKEKKLKVPQEYIDYTGHKIFYGMSKVPHLWMDVELAEEIEGRKVGTAGIINIYSSLESVPQGSQILPGFVGKKNPFFWIDEVMDLYKRGVRRELSIVLACASVHGNNNLAIETNTKKVATYLETIAISVIGSDVKFLLQGQNEQDQLRAQQLLEERERRKERDRQKEEELREGLLAFQELRKADEAEQLEFREANEAEQLKIIRSLPTADQVVDDYSTELNIEVGYLYTILEEEEEEEKRKTKSAAHGLESEFDDEGAAETAAEERGGTRRKKYVRRYKSKKSRKNKKIKTKKNKKNKNKKTKKYSFGKTL